MSDEALQPGKAAGGSRRFKSLRNDSSLFLLALPGVIVLVLFAYLPMSGLILVFKNYNYNGGIFGSPWAGFENFEFFFSSMDNAIRATRNTVMLNVLYMLTGTFFSVAIAIVLNELRGKLFIKITQSVMFFPYFISWIVIGAILFSFLDFDKGVMNRLLEAVGMQPVDWYSNPWLFVVVLVLANIWKSAGYGAIIYYAVLQGIDPSYYEAARIDGASRIQLITRITLPLLIPSIILLTLLGIGGMLKGDLSMIMGVTFLNPLLLPTTDIIDVYVYRTAIRSGEFGFASAITLYQSVFGFLLVLIANKLAGWYDKESKLF
ncbi:putative aldouronate transport system permease protein [Paenibacillus algorifonticola]|uniref:Putative aldouronate transport system permease protein n=1 Tax=Paenibacillus algorifonticola TaxID=684063 RepID=A0A1I2GHI9_9BACL|nr:ABC transporter permease subunit [Paenibacillus algorifonticola]SFF16972.1 putative aldouronate transport system permease protein [Paenibacillus algorifonticola]